MTGQYSQAPVCVCPRCGKNCFVRRKDAKKWSRGRLPGQNWSVYRCGEYWHYGHKPEAMRSGAKTRLDYDYNRKRKLKKLARQLAREEERDTWTE